MCLPLYGDERLAFKEILQHVVVVVVVGGGGVCMCEKEREKETGRN